jgi:adenine-specific DNA-methyltransferase
MNDDTKLPLTSADLTDALLAQLREAAPQVFSEGRVDFTKLQAALGEHIETGAERYGLNWAGKRDAFRNVQIPSVAALRPQPEESVNWDSTENLIIEGDNLEVLKLLQKPYHGKVKMIYIDPPYNTGNEFIYPDNFREGLDEYLRYTGQLSSENTATSTNKDTNGRYHSNWLNMMYPRLFLARNLLKDDGVIFVSIDDHEVHNLRMLMDEVFGEENFIGLFALNSSPSAIDYGHIAKMHDYAIFYAKHMDDTVTNHLEEANKAFKYTDSVGPFNIYPLYNGNVAFNPKTRPNLYYPFYLNPKNKIGDDFYEIALDAHEGWVEVYPVVSRKEGIPRVWRWGKAKASQDLNKEIIGYETEDGEYRVVQKTRHTGKVIRSLLLEKDISSRRGTSDFEEVFKSKIFSFPKPVELIKKFVSVGTESDSLIFDFFAGSGTTAQSVLELNNEDGGNRRFILVQLPEKTDNPKYPTIAHITRERVRRVIAKLKENENGKLALDPEQDLGFRAFKLDSSNFKIWQADAAPKTAEQMEEQLKLYADNVQAERGEQDRLHELVLKSGYPLSSKIEAVAVGDKTAFAVGDGNLLICLAEHLDQGTLRALFARNSQMVLCLDTAFDGNDALKTNTVLEAKTHGIIFKTV